MLRQFNFANLWFQKNKQIIEGSLEVKQLPTYGQTQQ